MSLFSGFAGVDCCGGESERESLPLSVRRCEERNEERLGLERVERELGLRSIFGRGSERTLLSSAISCKLLWRLRKLPTRGLMGSAKSVWVHMSDMERVTLTRLGCSTAVLALERGVCDRFEVVLKVELLLLRLRLPFLSKLCRLKVLKMGLVGAG